MYRSRTRISIQKGFDHQKTMIEPFFGSLLASYVPASLMIPEAGFDLRPWILLNQHFGQPL
ncbi:hypothetical protein CSV76_09785 [Sporosarcina sp. P17b]|nr:hypothetical protein CSV76_09785 [Sporosarcina sp. P17b]